MRERAAAFLGEVLGRGGEARIVFSHGHFLRVLALVFLDLPDGAGARLNLGTGSVSVLRAGDHGNLIQLWNDAGHLPGAPA